MVKLQIGKITTKTIGIYFKHFQDFYRIAFFASFWLFIPVYGWAKYASMMGLLARLAYSEVAETQESLSEAKRFIKPRLWLFFSAGLVSSIIFLYKLIGIPFLIFALIRITLGLASIISPTLFANFLFSKIFWTIFFYIFLYYWFRLISRFFFYEMSLAIDRKTNVTKSRAYSWDLVKNSLLKVQLTVFLLFMILGTAYKVLFSICKSIIGESSFIPIIILENFNWYNSLFFHGIFNNITIPFGTVYLPSFMSFLNILWNLIIYNSSETREYLDYTQLSSILFVIASIIISSLLIPLHQTVKAIIYYELQQAKDSNQNLSVN